MSRAASVVHVGLAYNSDVKTLPLSVQLQDMSFGTAHRKNVTGISLRVLESAIPLVGQSFDSLYQPPTRGRESPGTPPARKDGEIDLPLQGHWSNDGEVCIRQNKPLPMKVSSITVTCDIV